MPTDRADHRAEARTLYWPQTAALTLDTSTQCIAAKLRFT